MFDFTVETYKKLLESLKNSGYTFQSFKDYLKNPLDKVVILRHDVDRLPKNALKIAEVERNLGIKATYYFRIIPSVFNKEIIKNIYDMGHEIGYHYEELSEAKGNLEKAFEMFKNNLQKMREIVPIETICMHGSSHSKWDNKDIWKKYDYKNFRIIGEPYLDLDFNKVLYLTDTGQRWDADNITIRDKVSSSLNLKFKSTFEIINGINVLPPHIMINVHPDRWSNNIFYLFLLKFYMVIRNYLKKNVILKNR